MKILFLTLLDFNSLNEQNIYTDLFRVFVKHGHSVCVVSPVERRTGRKTELLRENQVSILKLRIGNVQKTNLIEKGMSTVANSHFLRTAGPHFPDSPGHIKRTAWDISRAEGTPPH